MKGISDIRIIGIDEKRIPIVRKEPYIDLFFRLSHEVPEDWCDEFNKLAKNLDPPAKIDKNDGLYINAYVRDMNQIAAHLENLKQQITACNDQYIEQIRLKDLAAAAKGVTPPGEEGEQGKLNRIIAALKFDD